MCLFCERNTLEVIMESPLSFVIWDKFPVNEGHALVIPKRHAETYFDLTQEEVLDMYELSLAVKHLIDDQYHPTGYNIGFNVNASGGQTIAHCHMHIIPRYESDVSDPRGGIRGVIPSRQKY